MPHRGRARPKSPRRRRAKAGRREDRARAQDGLDARDHLLHQKTLRCGPADALARARATSARRPFAPPRGRAGRARRRRPRSCAGCRRNKFSTRRENRCARPLPRPRRQSATASLFGKHDAVMREGGVQLSPAKARSQRRRRASPAAGLGAPRETTIALSARTVGTMPCRNGKPAACCAATRASLTCEITRPKATIGFSVLLSSSRSGVTSPQASGLARHRGGPGDHVDVGIGGGDRANVGGNLHGRGDSDVERIFRRDARLHHRQQPAFVASLKSGMAAPSLSA